MLSAVGRAYLAYCPEKERERILTLLRKSDSQKIDLHAMKSVCVKS